MKESDLNKFDFKSFYNVMRESRPDLIFKNFSLQCDYRTVNKRDCLEIIQFLLERCQTAELDGYLFDCRDHPTQRKKKNGCISGVSKAGNHWFSLSRPSVLHSLTLKHTRVHLPTLIGPNSCKIKEIRLSGSQNFPQLAKML